MSTPPPPSGPPNEEELRALYEEQMRRLRVEDILMNSVVDLINQGMRRTGLAQGYENERDAAQVRLAIESVRALMPVVESVAPQQMSGLRDAVSQLQLAYVQIGGTAPQPGGATSGSGSTGPAGPEGGSPGGPGTPPAEPASPQPPAPKPGEAGPAQQSGRLWIPGQ
jgi:hypothetical protein